jgi:hypothetical protein
MALRVPTADGQVNLYNLSDSGEFTPRVYFVNGVRTLARVHAVTASYLSLLIERPVWGVYNATAGVGFPDSLRDFLQCLPDYLQNALARLGSRGDQGRPPRISEAELPAFLEDLERTYVVWNEATLALFKELARHRDEKKLIIAHSQGNLITSNALFVMEQVLGPASLGKVRVYSLASPAPAWPLGLRKTHGGGGRQDNAFMNDLVALLRPHNLASKVGIDRFQNAGDFRTYAGSMPGLFAPHDTGEIIATLNFLKSIRGDLGLSKELTPRFLEERSRMAEEAIPGEKAR